MTPRLKLSICCISYNHSDYICDAIRSFLKQNSNFRMEIVISDDNSTDDTQEKIRVFANDYPEIIKFIPREVNVGMNENFFSTISYCDGEYISVCEGDDYWTDIDKLIKQIEIMDNDNKIVLVSHDVETISNVVEKCAYKAYADVPSQIGGFTDVLFSHFIPTLSIVLRREALPEIWPDFFYKIKSPDKALALSLMLKGLYYHHPDVMGVYRHHDGGITKRQLSGIDYYSQEYFLYHNFFNYFKLDSMSDFRKKMASVSYSAAIRSFIQKDYNDFILLMIKGIRFSPLYFVGLVLKRLSR